MAIALGGMGSTQRLQTIDEVGATAIWCTPTYALRLLEVAVEQRLESALDSVERVLCTGEPGASLPAVRARIEEGFGARCIDHAGLTEAGPFGHPCPDGHGLHVDESEFVCEIVDEDLRPTPLGERGELLLTPLRRTGFPVLRYRTGDVVVNTDERCPAGHEGRWLPGGIVGRSDDMVVIRGMNVYPSAIEEAVRHASGLGRVPHHLLLRAERHGRDQARGRARRRQGRARAAGGRCASSSGLRVRVVPVTPGVLPRHDGKARRVVDERTRNGPASDHRAHPHARAADAAAADPRRQRAGGGPDPALHPGGAACGRATSWGARRTWPPSSASAARRCARRSSCSPAAT